VLAPRAVARIRRPMVQGFGAAASGCIDGGVDGKTLLSLNEADFIAELGLTKLQVHTHEPAPLRGGDCDA
jgi:hypothetical protein